MLRSHRTALMRARTPRGVWSTQSLAHGSGERARLELKLVGGSRLRPDAADLGPRAVIYWPGTGQLQIRKLRGIQTLLAEREREYGRLPDARRVGAARA